MATEVEIPNAEDKPAVKKAVKSAVVIIPPESCWEQIQEIRSKYDKAFKRWMPHINLLYPFIPDENDGEDFKKAAKVIQEGLSSVKPFTITMGKEAFGFFSHSKKTTMWLKPMKNEPVSNENDNQSTDGAASCDRATAEAGGFHPGVMEIQNKLVELYPNFQSSRSENGFQPHLSLGQFGKNAVRQFITEFQSSWKDLQFEVEEIYLISRADFHDPFHVRHTVKLGIK